MASKSSERNKILGGMAWKLGERLSSQGVSFVVSIILARLLTPAEYGIIAMMNIFIVIANVFVISGFNTSLIQKKDADELDFSTIYYCTLVMSIIMYVVIFFSAPLMARYYDMPEMTVLTRVFALSLIIQSYQTIQQAYVARHMQFKLNFKATLIGTTLSGVIGVAMAYAGYGVWALVSQHISGIVINTLVLRFLVEWRPRLMFSWERAKGLMSYGSKIMGSTLVNTLYKEARQLLIGLYYTPADLALYNRGSHMPHLVTTNLDNTLRSVLFPAMSNHSDDLPRVKQMLKRAIQNTSYVTYFFLTLMAVASKPLIHVLLTDKWIDCVPYMQIMCVSLMLNTVGVTNLQALKAIGKSNEVLKLELFKKPVFLLVILASLPFGVMAVVCTSPINSLYALWTNMGPTKKYLNYSHMEQIKDLLPSIFLTCSMALVTWPITLLPWNDFLIMGIQVIVAIISYIGFSVIFKVDAYYYCKNIILEFISKRKKYETTYPART